MKTMTLDKNRYLINLMFKRAKRFHASVSGCSEVDCHETLNELGKMRRSGIPATLTAFLVKASAAVIEAHPGLNRHVFTTLLGRQRIVQFDDIVCTLIVRRVHKSNPLLLPVNIENPERKSVGEIGAEIQHHTETPFEELPQFAAFRKLHELPNFVLDYLSYKTRSSPRFYRKHYGTYGMSPMFSVRSSYQSMQTLANTAMALVPYGLVSRRSESGAKRKHVRVAIVFDHFVVDGDLMAQAAYAMTKHIKNPYSLLSAGPD